MDVHAFPRDMSFCPLERFLHYIFIVRKLFQDAMDLHHFTDTLDNF